MDELPDFRYHQEPARTGSIVSSSEVCEVCDRARGYIYEGPFYAVDEVEAMCPWCIADGSAAAAFDGTFTDLEGPEWAEVSAAVKSEVLTQTPGFSGWQQERWFAHCSDAMQFLDRVGRQELLGHGPAAVEAIKADMRPYGWTEENLSQYVENMDRDGQPTGYLFRCTTCGTFRGYSDFT